MIVRFCGQNAVERLGVCAGRSGCISDNIANHRLSDMEGDNGKSGEIFENGKEKDR